jgi:hypothetical protein
MSYVRMTQPSGIRSLNVRRRPFHPRAGGSRPRRAAGAPVIINVVRLAAPNARDQGSGDRKQETVIADRGHGTGNRKSRQSAGESGSARFFFLLCPVSPFPAPDAYARGSRAGTIGRARLETFASQRSDSGRITRRSHLDVFRSRHADDGLVAQARGLAPRHSPPVRTGLALMALRQDRRTGEGSLLKASPRRVAAGCDQSSGA